MTRVLGGKPCHHCGRPKPPGRARYCGDECSQAVSREREERRQAARMTACRSCGGAKEPGVRGGKFCAECRRVHADVVEQMEQERYRRRRLADRARKEATGYRFKSRNDAPEGMKWCARCQEFRPLASFPPRQDGVKRCAYCRPCQKAYNRMRRVKIIFGLDWDDYELLLACQDGRCAICGGHPRKYALSVDHDHKTGEIRGLLCTRCNHRLLGSANDNPARLRKAADYLEMYGPREVFGERRFLPGFGEPLTEAEAAS